jgi:hypothetical protein
VRLVRRSVHIAARLKAALIKTTTSNSRLIRLERFARVSPQVISTDIRKSPFLQGYASVFLSVLLFLVLEL